MPTNREYPLTRYPLGDLFSGADILKIGDSFG